MDWSELLNSLKSAAKERLGNSLVGSFVLTWCVVNWRVPVLLFWGDSVKPSDRIDAVAAYVRADDTLDLWVASVPTHVVLVPLLVALSYVLLFPFPQRWIAMLAEWQRRRTTAATLKIRGDQLPDSLALDRAAEALAAVERRNVVLQSENDTLRESSRKSGAGHAAAENALRDAHSSYGDQIRKLTSDLAAATAARQTAEQQAEERLRVIEAVEAAAVEIGRAADPKFPEGVTEPGHANLARAALQAHTAKHLERTQELARANNRHQAAIDAANEDGRTARDRLFRVLQALGLTLDGTRAIEKSIAAVESKRSTDLGARRSPSALVGGIASTVLAERLKPGSITGTTSGLSEDVDASEPPARLRGKGREAPPPASS